MAYYPDDESAQRIICNDRWARPRVKEHNSTDISAEL